MRWENYRIHANFAYLLTVRKIEPICEMTSCIYGISKLSNVFIMFEKFISWDLICISPQTWFFQFTKVILFICSPYQCFFMILWGFFLGVINERRNMMIYQIRIKTPTSSNLLLEKAITNFVVPILVPIEWIVCVCLCVCTTVRYPLLNQKSFSPAFFCRRFSDDLILQCLVRISI